jgi:hypothetical protein
MSAPLVTLTRVESSLLLREPAAVLFTLGLPLLLLSLNGSQGNAPDPELGGAGAIDVLVAGYLVYVMATSSIMTLAETLADYRDRGILRRMRVSPLRPWQVLGSHALTHLAMSLVGSALLVGLGLAAFDLRALRTCPRRCWPSSPRRWPCCRWASCWVRSCPRCARRRPWPAACTSRASSSPARCSRGRCSPTWRSG